jgi:hypothetical protein
MALAAGVAGVRATLDLGSKSTQCIQCWEPDSARITGNPEVMPLDQYRDAEGNGSNQASIDYHISVGLATFPVLN